MTKRIAEDFFMFQGGIELKQWLPSYCNTYLLRDENNLILYDTSAFEDIRNEMLKIIKKYEGVCSKFYLIVGHADPDHIGNNEMIDDVKIKEKHFLIHEAGLSRLNVVEDEENLTQEMMEYYDVFGAFPVSAVRFLSKISPRIVSYIKRKGMERFWTVSRTKQGMAESLSDYEEVPLTIGGATFQGWKLGNIYLIHDGAHVPEHLCLYDTKRRILLVGDLTGGYNPMFNSETDRLIEYCDVFTKMAEEGYIEIVGDGHRNREAYDQVFTKYDITPFTQYQTSDYLQGKEEIKEFFRGFSSYYREIRDTILDVHKNSGSATIEEIVLELRKSDSQAIQMKLKLEFPRFLSWIRTSVASVIRESGAKRRKIGKQIYFEPVF